MILMPISNNVHYKCAFDIYFDDENGIIAIRQVLKEWLVAHRSLRNMNRNAVGGWFDIGSEDQEITGDSYCRVAVNRGEYKSINPLNWAFEFIHKDSIEPARIWCTEIGLTRFGEFTVRFACLLKYAVFEGWVGPLPAEPSFSVPRFVTTIVSKFPCYKGGVRLQHNIQECLVGNAQILSDIIVSNDRILPIVVSAPDEHGNDPVDLHTLQRIVTANANVFYLPCDKIYHFNQQMPKDLGMRPGMVRVYAKILHEDNSNRHRFYTKSKIEEYGKDTVLSQIGIALSRNSKTFLAGEIIRIKDVIHARSMSKLQQLKSEKIEDYKGYSELLEAENADLEEKVKQYETEIDDAKSNASSLENELKKVKAKFYCLENVDVQRSAGFNAFYQLSELPQTITDALGMLGSVFSERLIIHENALDTASNFPGCNDINCVNAVWKMGYHLATDMYELLFRGKNYDLEKEFLNRTGIELGMSETKQTKKDKKLMKKRVCIHKGKEIDFAPHLKGKRTEGFLRMHFAVDEKDSKIIICYCGEHIETSGTRRKSL
jgi:hypothetical protein